MRIAVLMGGANEEREVSLSSGCAVAEALREAGHEVVAVDTTRGALSSDEEAETRGRGVGTTPPGERLVDRLASGDLSILREDPMVAEADLLFPALHGAPGEDGTVQTLLEVAGRPYVGSGPVASALAMDKDLTKRILRDGAISTAPWLLDPGSAAEIEDLLGLPVILKPVSGGSSVHLTLAHDQDELDAALAAAREGGNPRMMAEGYVSGREVTVGIVGDEALPVGEIRPAHELFDYECKYQPGLAEEIFPADLPVETASELRDLALRAHRLLRLRDFSRIDFILDGGGRAWCLEANTLPGMTPNSLLPRAGRARGWSFPELCDRIVREAHARRRGRTETPPASPRRGGTPGARRGLHPQAPHSRQVAGEAVGLDYPETGGSASRPSPE